MEASEDGKGDAHATAIEMHLAAIQSCGHRPPLFLTEVTDLVEAAILSERERSASAGRAAALCLRGWPVSEEQADEIASSIRSGAQP